MTRDRGWRGGEREEREELSAELRMRQGHCQRAGVSKRNQKLEEERRDSTLSNKSVEGLVLATELLVRVEKGVSISYSRS